MVAWEVLCVTLLLRLTANETSWTGEDSHAFILKQVADASHSTRVSFPQCHRSEP